MNQTKTLLSISVLCILYVVGLFGTALFRLNLMHLTSINLLISAFLLFLNHTRLNNRFVGYAVIVFVCGWLLEWVGVETGRIFGQYFYGNNLGVKLLDVPIIIGMNWLLLNYCSSVIASRFGDRFALLNSPFPQAFIAAALMVLVDFFIEQVAPVYDFWYWKNQTVPLQNYTAWFAFAFAFAYLFQRLDIHSENKVAIWLYGLMLAFFVGLNVIPAILV
jgi:putative membrane protein